ncbi:uncharacterized protein DFL_001528 [Arthrobotrys flagrans]|uniref:RTA1 like protein n=1 Tax=Arthrobotrys flagrans TaxID=97331 RepID=A0A437A857_ARTFL|nr:hypothetical protein DFL_001528 [Arthrobotrys flagrans]
MGELRPVPGSDVYLWKYLPSIPASAVFLGLFAIVTAFHCWRIFGSRTWFCIPFAVGGIFQVTGYGVRIYCYYHTEQIASYAIQSSLIILAPIFYAASIYMVLRRLICSVKGERFSPVRARWLTWIFVTGDIIALSIQGNAVGLTTKAKTQKIGEWIITAGLLVQIFIFGFFIYVCGIFHFRMNKNLKESPRTGPHLTVPWKAGLKMLYACSALIMVRSVFRVIEYIMGVDAYLLANEWSWYVFDAVLMFATQVIFVVWYPDQFQIQETVLKSEGESEDGHMLVEGAGSRRGFGNC